VTRLSTVALISLVTIGLSIPVVIEGRSRLLTRLQQCYREVPTQGRQFFESPCQSIRLRMLVLAGISISPMEATLGPANGCFDTDLHTGRWKHTTCWEPAWVFYDLPRGSLGGGPNLVCWSLNGDTCLTLYWLYTA
jgi:hypothetical protein